RHTHYLHSFPTRRSSDLETAGGTPILLHKTQYLPESECQASVETVQGTLSITFQSFNTMDSQVISDPCDVATNKLETVLALDGKDRKSTRLNSSHVSISY